MAIILIFCRAAIFLIYFMLNPVDYNLLLAAILLLSAIIHAL